MAEGTVILKAKVDIAPEGIVIRFDSIDSDLAELMKRAKTFSVTEKEDLSSESSNLVIHSDKVIAFVDRPEPRE